MIRIRAPKDLCIYDDIRRPATLDFLNEIETKVVLEKARVIIDLEGVREATAAASLLFFAIVNRAQLLVRDNQAIRFSFPKKDKNEEGHSCIVRTALSKALLANSFSKLGDLTKEEVFFQSAVDPDSHSQSTLQMLDRHGKFNDEQLYLLSMGIGEAMLNVSHHAYETVRGVDFGPQIQYLGGKRWWQCSWFDHEKDVVVFIICDLGLGIAKSYTSTQQYDVLPDEPSLVNEALSCGRSRFRGLGRGNGSEDIKRPVGEGCTNNESLLVLSGNTQYYYTSATVAPMCNRMSEHIPGTLVEWSLVPRRNAL